MVLESKAPKPLSSLSMINRDSAVNPKSQVFKYFPDEPPVPTALKS